MKSWEMDDKELISVQVRNPRTHLKNKWSSFTDYEIVISTNSMAFALQHSTVRRRFSEFEWLKRTLAKSSSISTNPPSLPNKKVLGRFNRDFLEKRRASLQEFLTKVVSIVTYLSEAAVHLFLQSNLTVKEIERVLEGEDRREMTELIFQENEINERIGRKESEQTNTDSGFSGSTNIDRHMPDCALQCQGLGNGWSSGCINLSDSSRKRKVSCSACRRKSLPFHAASVLPTGQLLVAEDNQDISNKTNLNGSISSSDRCPEESCTRCNQYDADDETDANFIDYDVINTRKVRMRDWLSKVTPEVEIITSKNETSPPTSRTIPEYDVISVPCLSNSAILNTMSSRSMDNFSGNGTCEYEESEGSEYSVVHSTIGGLELENFKALCHSSSTLSSAGIYRTYDVVEMVELK